MWAVELHVGVDVAHIPAAPRDLSKLPGGQEDDERPPHADEQPVAAGHVGERERCVLVWVGTGLEGEREVDRVFGEHGDERQHGQREAARHVDLERFGPPGHEERGPHDRDPEDD